MKFLVLAAILVVGQATKVKVHVPKEAAEYLQDLNIDDIPKKITVHLNGINPSDVLPLLSEFSPQVNTEDEKVDDQPAHIKVHMKPVQKDAGNKIRLHLHGAALADLLSSLSSFAPLLEGGKDAPHIRIHLKPRVAEEDTVANKKQLNEHLDNLLISMQQNDPELYEIYTTDDRADEFKEKRSVQDIAKEKFVADLKVSMPLKHAEYMSLPAEQQDAFLGGLLSGVGHVAKGVASIKTGEIGLGLGALGGAAKGIVGVPGHIIGGATAGCRSGIFGCVGGAIGGTVKGAGNIVVDTLGGAHKGAHIGLNIFDKKKPRCPADLSAACAGQAANGLCTANAAWTNYMRVNCASSCCGQIAAAPCADTMNCAAYQPYCHHPNYVASLKHRCRATCHFC